MSSMKSVKVQSAPLMTAELLQSIEQQMLSAVLTRTQVQRNLQQAMQTLARQGVRPAHVVNINLSRVRIQHAGMTSEQGCTIGDLDLTPETTTLPQCISHELRAAGVQTVKWTDLRQLPGAMFQGIWELGMSVFQHFGLKKNAMVKVIACTEQSDLLNSALEVNAVLNFLEHGAVKCSADNMTMNFDGSIDGYCPEVRLYYTEKHAYLAVFEDVGLCGRYIYAFERDTTKSITDSTTKMLK